METNVTNIRKTKEYKSKYENSITKQMLEQDMYQEKLSQRAIAEKYNVGKGTIQNLQYRYKLEILNLFERRVPRSLTFEQKQTIYGTVIADGHIFRKSEKQHGALSIKHSMKQEEWIDAKFEVLKEFIRTKPTIQVSWINGQRHLCKSFRTLTHDFFTFLHNKIYIKNEDGKYEKHLSIEILNNIEPLGLSVVYMDDGTPHHKQRDFCFECYPFEEQKMFCDWLFNKFNIKARPIKYKDNFWRTRVYSWQEFDKLVSPFIIDKMKYKIQKN